VQRILEAHRLAPHRIRAFKLSTRNLPKSSGTSSVSMSTLPLTPLSSRLMKSRIQALDRTQPGLPMKKGRAGTMAHNYKRNGTTTLFAALNVLDGTVIGRNTHRHDVDEK
jgi:hypothetical protein